MSKSAGEVDEARDAGTSRAVARKLQDINKELSSKANRWTVAEETWHELGRTLAEAVPCLDDGDDEDSARLHGPLGDCFRALRNACGGEAENADHVACHPGLVKSAVHLVRHLTGTHRDSSSGDCLTALRCGVQFLGNLVSCCQAAKEPVWTATAVEKPPVYRTLLASRDDRVRLYSSMLLYNCLSPERVRSLLATEESSAIVSSLADTLAGEDSEWSLFTLDLMVQCDLFFRVYAELDPRSRCVILDLVAERLGRSDPADSAIPNSSLEYLCERFRGRVMDIVRSAEPEGTREDWDLVEIGKLLGVLCAASVHEELSVPLKENEAVLEMAVDILKTMHFLGKRERNAFTPVCHLDDLAEAQDGSSRLAEHPAFGFKRGLVRLVGNMCHASRRNQDLVRQMDGIPVVLDVCNLDARNPYIIQWAILAVRNLLEGNPENQEVVAGLVGAGLVADCPILGEMGVRPDRS